MRCFPISITSCSRVRAIATAATSGWRARAARARRRCRPRTRPTAPAPGSLQHPLQRRQRIELIADAGELLAVCDDRFPHELKRCDGFVDLVDEPLCLLVERRLDGPDVLPLCCHFLFSLLRSVDDPFQ